MRILSLALAALVCSAAAVAQKDCEVTSYGTSCGPVYKGHVVPNGNTNKVTFTVSNVKPGSRVFIVVGSRKEDFPLDPIFGGNLGCRLLCKLTFVQQHIAVRGTYSWGHALPSTNVGIAFSQAAVVVPGGTPELLTSNGLQLVCK